MPPPASFVIRHSSFDIPRRRRRRGGFALLITITLLAFLVLLLVSLAALTRVETQVASNNQQIAQARQNALLALHIAVGQLQKHAGPDQRITARADLESGATTPNARWTAVYGPAIAPDYDQPPSDIAASLTNPAAVNATTGSSARLLSWLVSGNEGGAFNPTTDVAPAGHITADAVPLRASLDFSPTTAINGLNATATTATTLTLTASDNTSHPAALLVGPGTVNPAVSGAQAIDFVAAPLVKIEVPAGQLPGLSGSTPTTIGRYAWWVGDEGVKARINLPLVTTDADKPAAFATASRAAIELMDAANPSLPVPALDAPRIGPSYDPAANVDRLLALNQITLAGTPALRDSLRRRYHDLTPHSTGVLSDTYAGGLRRDLSALLDSGFTPAASYPETDTTRLHALDPLPDLHTEEVAGFGVPTWGHLRTHYRNLGPSAGGHLTPRLPILDQPGQPDDVGLSPVLTYAGLGFAFAVNGGAIEFNVHPLVVLWNPYTHPIADHTYEVGIRIPPPGANLQFQVSNPAASPRVWQARETRDVGHEGYRLGSDIDPPVSDTTGRYFRFNVRSGVIPPGESIVYTLPSNTTYNRSASTPCAIELVQGLEDETHATLSGGSLDPSELSWDYRVVAAGPYFKSVPNRNHWSGVRFANIADFNATTDENGAPLSAAGRPELRGALDAYLGEPRTAPVTTVAADDIWDHRRNRWYQLASAVQYGAPSVPAGHILQGGEGALVSSAAPGDPPGAVLLLSALFARGGNNATLQSATSNNYSWLLNGNPRAPLHFKTRRDDTGTTNYAARVDINGWPTWFVTDAPGDRASSGFGHDWHAGAPIAAPLFEVRHDANATLNLGRLQHANLSLIGTQPAYPLGNSRADPRFFTLDKLTDTTMVRGSTRPEPARLQAVYYDNSFLLNRSLWDRYFLSSLPRVANPEPVNPSIDPRETTYNLADPASAAAGLLVNGAFNVNSTSEQAWRALLGAVNQLAYDPESPGSPPPSPRTAALSRFERPTADASVPAAAPDAADLWRGYRELSETEIAQLARNIVAEVRARGPFISVADFINRRLIDNPATPEDERLKGALQAAIDATQRTGSGAFAANNTAGTYWQNAAVRTFTSIGNNNRDFHRLDSVLGSALGVTDHASGRRVITDSAQTEHAAFRRLAAGAPKFLTQADVLSTLGAQISARSDTFLIRTYGETVNPATNETTGRAWCEAVVQRLPEYPDASVQPWQTPAAGSTDARFGRRFEIVSFRWLNADEI